MSLPKFVKIVEVGPRDGLQNESAPVSVDDRVTFINLLSDSGLQSIEAGSFVSPKWVPQMANSDTILKTIKHRKGVSYPVLTSNERGFQDALAAGAGEIAVFAAASETFSQKNINCSIDESLQRFHNITKQAVDHDIRVRGYISCVLDCPYEGEVNPEQVAEIAKNLFDAGCYEISLGDTIGTGTPLRAQKMVDEVSKHIDIRQIAVHFHDTYGQALANIYATLQQGVSVVDSSVAGLGGCPYAAGASGNVATEDVIYLLNGLGIETGVSMDKLLEAGAFISDVIGRQSVSRAGTALTRKRTNLH